jgi:hypothetical protein
MKRVIFVLLFSCFAGLSFAQQLTAREKNNVCHVVGRYCKFLSDYTESITNFVYRDSIYELFPRGVGDIAQLVVDDLESLKMTAISNYLSKLSSPDKFNYRVKITYAENAYDMEVTGLTMANHRNKSEKITHGRIKLTKQTKGDLEKTINNVFHVKLDNSKIERIFVESQDETATEGNELSLLDKGMQAFTSKRYAEALEYFEKSSQTGNAHSMYQAGYLYFANKGCGKLSNKERKNRAYHWLNVLAFGYNPNKQYNSDSPIILARELLDRMGYYNE